MRISDVIENFLKDMLAEDEFIEIQRNELAELLIVYHRK